MTSPCRRLVHRVPDFLPEIIRNLLASETPLAGESDFRGCVLEIAVNNCNSTNLGL